MAGTTLRVTGGSAAGTDHDLDGELILGREGDLSLTDRGVSRRHARVADEGDWIVVEDLGSSNGTWVNGARIAEPVEVVSGDEIQLGEAVLQLVSGDAATQVMGAGAAEPPTDEHPGPWGAAAASPPPRSPRRRPTSAPRRNPVEEGNLPALAAVFCGPLSIFLVIFSTGASFFVSLPVAIAAIVFGNIGMRKVDRGEADSHRALAHVGKITGIIGVVLSVVALIFFLVVAALLDNAEDSLSALLERLSAEFGADLNLPGGLDERIREELQNEGGGLRDVLDRVGQ